MSGEPIDVSEMDEAERVALPAIRHLPHWDGLGEPHSWICTVCWGDGWVTQWPCEPATTGGLELAKAMNVGWSW